MRIILIFECRIETFRYRDKYGRSAAHWAVYTSAECILALAGVPGVDWNAREVGGQTPVCYAVSEAERNPGARLRAMVEVAAVSSVVLQTSQVFTITEKDHS